MIIRMAVAILCLVVGACSVRPPPDTAVLPFAAFGTMDNDVAAANQAAWAFAAPERIANNPVDAARAAAAIDYLAGELASNPRWMMISPLTKQKMVPARFDVRQVTRDRAERAIAGGGEHAAAVCREWQAGNQAGAIQALAVPGFTLPPEPTLRALRPCPISIRPTSRASTQRSKCCQVGCAVALEAAIASCHNSRTFALYRHVPDDILLRLGGKI